MTSAALDRLPEQVLDDIASYLDRPSAYALCLVSRTFLWPARRALYHTIRFPAITPTQMSSVQRWEQLCATVSAKPHLASMIRKMVYTCQTEQTVEAVQFVLNIIRKADNLQLLHWAAALDYLPNAREVLSTLNDARFPGFTLTVDKWHPRSIVPTRPLRVLTLKQGPWSASITLSAVLDLVLSECQDPVKVEQLVMVDIGEYYGDGVDISGLLAFIKPPESIRLTGCHLDNKAFATLMAWAGTSLTRVVLQNCQFHVLNPTWDPYPDEPIAEFPVSLLHLHYLETDTLACPLVPIPEVQVLQLTHIDSANLSHLPVWFGSGTNIKTLDFRQCTRDGAKCPSPESVQLVEALAKDASIAVLPLNFLQELAAWAAKQTKLNEQEALAMLTAQGARRQDFKDSSLPDDDFAFDLFDYPEEDD